MSGRAGTGAARWLRLPGLGWVGVALLLAGGAIGFGIAMTIAGGLHMGTPLADALDWQPGAERHEPWRLWSCAWVHGSSPHLAVNLAGAAVVAGVGWRARAPRAAALAWLAAWPLTHLLLGLPGDAPAQGVHFVHFAQRMQHYGGLSGVLHAGVAVLGLALAFPAALGREAAQPPLAPLTPAQATRHRLIGLGLVAGTLAKVLLEAPWDLALRPSALLGIGVAPLAHACGLAAGALAWGAVAAVVQARRLARRRAPA